MTGNLKRHSFLITLHAEADGRIFRSVHFAGHFGPNKKSSDKNAQLPARHKATNVRCYEFMKPFDLKMNLTMTAGF